MLPVSALPLSSVTPPGRFLQDGVSFSFNCAKRSLGHPRPKVFHVACGLSCTTTFLHWSGTTRSSVAPLLPPFDPSQGVCHVSPPNLFFFPPCLLSFPFFRAQFSIVSFGFLLSFTFPWRPLWHFIFFDLHSFFPFDFGLSPLCPSGWIFARQCPLNKSFLFLLSLSPAEEARSPYILFLYCLTSPPFSRLLATSVNALDHRSS